jgi:hypothetical protein
MEKWRRRCREAYLIGAHLRWRRFLVIRIARHGVGVRLVSLLLVQGEMQAGTGSGLDGMKLLTSKVSHITGPFGPVMCDIIESARSAGCG